MAYVDYAGSSPATSVGGIAPPSAGGGAWYSPAELAARARSGYGRVVNSPWARRLMVPAAALSLYNSYETPTEEYYARFGMDPNNAGFWPDVGVRAAGVAGDWANLLTGGHLDDIRHGAAVLGNRMGAPMPVDDSGLGSWNSVQPRAALTAAPGEIPIGPGGVDPNEAPYIFPQTTREQMMGGGGAALSGVSGGGGATGGGSAEQGGPIMTTAPAAPAPAAAAIPALDLTKIGLNAKQSMMEQLGLSDEDLGDLTGSEKGRLLMLLGARMAKAGGEGKSIGAAFGEGVEAYVPAKQQMLDKRQALRAALGQAAGTERTRMQDEAVKNATLPLTLQGMQTQHDYYKSLERARQWQEERERALLPLTQETMQADIGYKRAAAGAASRRGYGGTGVSKRNQLTTAQWSSLYNQSAARLSQGINGFKFQKLPPQQQQQIVEQEMMRGMGAQAVGQNPQTGEVLYQTPSGYSFTHTPGGGMPPQIQQPQPGYDEELTEEPAY